MTENELNQLTKEIDKAINLNYNIEAQKSEKQKINGFIRQLDLKALPNKPDKLINEEQINKINEQVTIKAQYEADQQRRFNKIFSIIIGIALIITGIIVIIKGRDMFNITVLQWVIIGVSIIGGALLIKFGIYNAKNEYTDIERDAKHTIIMNNDKYQQNKKDWKEYNEAVEYNTYSHALKHKYTDQINTLNELINKSERALQKQILSLNIRPAFNSIDILKKINFLLKNRLCLDLDNYQDGKPPAYLMVYQEQFFDNKFKTLYENQYLMLNELVTLRRGLDIPYNNSLSDYQKEISQKYNI